MTEFALAGTTMRCLVEGLGFAALVAALVLIAVLFYFKLKIVMAQVVLLTIAHVLVLAGMISLKDVGAPPGSSGRMTMVNDLVGRVPSEVWLVWETLFLGASILIAMVIKGYVKRKTTRASVIEALNNLPNGICICGENGEPILYNKSMERLYDKLFGGPLIHPVRLIHLLDQGEPRSFGSIREVIPYREGVAVRLVDGETWRIFSGKLSDEGRHYTEIIAQDVTSLYEELDTIRERHDSLDQAGKELSRTLLQAEETKREKESLSVKIRVHERFGQMLLSAKQTYMDDEATEEQLVRSLSAWEETIEDLYDIFTEGEPKEDRAALDTLEKQLGIRIYFYDENDYNMDVINASDPVMAAIREAAINAKRHAGADALYVRVDDLGDDGTRYMIRDNGTLPKGPVTEGGGLSSVRYGLEQEGGSLSVSDKDGVCLTIFEPRGLRDKGKES